MPAGAVLLVSVVIWGWSFVATRVCLETLSPLAVVALRFLIGVPVLGAIVLAQRTPLRFTRADAGPLAFGAAIIAAHFLLQAVALTQTTATNTAWIIAGCPLAIAALAYAVLGERLSRRAIAGIVLATAGVALLVSRGDVARFSGLQSRGDALALISIFTWAAYTIVTRGLLRRHSSLAVTLVLFVPLTVVGTAALPALGQWPDAAALTPRVAVALVFLGVLGTAAQWFWQYGVARLGAARAGIFLYLEPLATTALALPLLDEDFGLAAAAGGVMVLAGVAWAESGRRSEQEPR